MDSPRPTAKPTPSTTRCSPRRKSRSARPSPPAAIVSPNASALRGSRPATRAEADAFPCGSCSPRTRSRSP
jgi:hypothetical protein